MLDVSPIQVRPVVLEGRRIRLEPMRPDHARALLAAASDPRIWEFFPSRLDDAANLDRWMTAAFVAAERGEDLPFVIVDRATDEVIGGTRFMDIRPAHRGVEIGNTWLNPRWWRTSVNSECKYLLLTHLFDTLGCIRVSLKTDLLNTRSQRAIERLGAVREGVLRQHMIVQGGRLRDTVYYSILDREWPAIRERMRRELDADPVSA